MANLHRLSIVFITFFAGLIQFGVAAVATAEEKSSTGFTQPLVLAPGPGNPRNSEGDFLTFDDGRVLFVYTHFTGGDGDEASAYLAGRWSRDSGRSWSTEDQVVVEKPSGVQNIMSVSLLRLQDKRLALFYLVKKSGAENRMVMRLSTDDAKTWQEPVYCMPDPGYYVVNNGRAVQLKSGRIILPAARHKWDSRNAKDHRGVAVCFISDDAGKTWHQSSTELEAPEKSRSGLQEPVVVELKHASKIGDEHGGRLMMLCRTDQGSQFQSYSQDGGETWSAALPSQLASPLSPASIARIPSTGDLLLAWNDHSGAASSLRNKRTPFTVAISHDEGQTWDHRKVLYDDPDGWYCYTAIAFSGNRVLLGHCAGKQTKTSSGLATTVVLAIDVDWLYR